MLKTQSLYQRKNRNQNKPFSLIEEQSQRTSNLLKSQRYKKKTNGPVLMNPGRTLPRDQLSSHRENNPSLLSPPVISTLNTDCAIPLYPVSLVHIPMNPDKVQQKRNRPHQFFSSTSVRMQRKSGKGSVCSLDSDEEQTNVLCTAATAGALAYFTIKSPFILSFSPHTLFTSSFFFFFGSFLFLA